MSKLAQAVVTFSRTTQPAPYESANASVSMTLAFDPDDDSSGEEVAAALADARAHVFGILGLDVTAPTAPAKKERNRSAPKAQADGDVKTKPADKVEDPLASLDDEKPAAKKETKAAKADEDPLAGLDDEKPAEEPEAPKYQKGDVNKAVTQAIGRMKEKGQADASDRVKKLIASYVTDKPAVLANIGEDSYGDFISDLNKMGR